jgi:hypothetical protein
VGIGDDDVELFADVSLRVEDEAGGDFEPRREIAAQESPDYLFPPHTEFAGVRYHPFCEISTHPFPRGSEHFLEAESLHRP